MTVNTTSPPTLSNPVNPINPYQPRQSHLRLAHLAHLAHLAYHFPVIRLTKEKKNVIVQQQRRSNNSSTAASPRAGSGPGTPSASVVENEPRGGRLRLAPSNYRALVEAPELIAAGKATSVVLEPLGDSQCGGTAVDDLELACMYLNEAAQRHGVQVFESEAEAEAAAAAAVEAGISVVRDGSDLKSTPQRAGGEGESTNDSERESASVSAHTDSPDDRSRTGIISPSTSDSLSVSQSPHAPRGNAVAKDAAGPEGTGLSRERGIDSGRTRAHSGVSMSIDASEAGFTSLDDSGGAHSTPDTPPDTPNSGSTLQSQFTSASVSNSATGPGPDNAARILTERHSLDQEIQRRER